jgi:hypothetical protein
VERIFTAAEERDYNPPYISGDLVLNF